MDKQEEVSGTKEIQVGNITVEMCYDDYGKSLEEYILNIMKNLENRL